MLLERVWAALDDFWSAHVWEGAQGPGAGRGAHGRGGGAAFGVHKDIVELLMQQKAGADCQVWHSAPFLCSVCSLRALCGQSCLGNCSAQHCSTSKPETCSLPALGGQGDSPECSQCQQRPRAGQHCPKSWLCSQPGGSSPVPSPKQHFEFAIVWMLGNLWTVCSAPSATHLARC